MKVSIWLIFQSSLVFFPDEIEFAFDLGVDENEQPFDSVYIHIYKWINSLYKNKKTLLNKNL